MDDPQPSTSSFGNTGFFPCSLCSNAYATKNELDSHVKTVHKKFICDICDLAFNRKSSLKRHKDQRHNFSSSTFNCDICHKTFSRKSNLRQHIALKHERNTPVYICENCEERFTRKSNLTQHIGLKHARNTPVYICEICKDKFTRKSSLTRHIGLKHSTNVPVYNCEICKETFTQKSNLTQHIAIKHARNTPLYNCGICRERFTHKRSLRRHITNVHSNIKIMCKLCTPPKIFKNQRSIDLHNRLKHNLPKSRFYCPKCTSSFYLLDNFKRHLEETHELKSSNFQCKRCPRKFLTEKGLLAHLGTKHRFLPKRVCCRLCSKTFATNSSLVLHLKLIHNIAGGCYFCRICSDKFKIKEELELHQCFSEKTLDTKYVQKSPPELNREESFKYAISSKDNSTVFEWGEDVTDFPSFERRNCVSLSIFSIHEGKLIPVYITSVGFVEEDKHFDLIRVGNVYHLILDFEGLLRNRISKHRHFVKMCRRCRAYFYNTPNKKAEEQLKRHTEFCQGISGGPLFNDTPKGNKTKLYFRNFENLRKKRFTIYLDFESLTTPAEEPGSSNTVVLQKHIPFSFGYLLKDEESDMLTNYRAYCGLDAPSKLFNMLKEDIEKIEKVLYTKRIRDVPELTDQQQHEFDLATTCHICLRGGFDDRNKKVRSHDHVSGRFYGAAHNRCNLFYRDQRVVNVVVHNLSRYDANFIIPELGKQDGKITVIPHTTDTFISFTKKMGGMTVQFIDSYRFLSFSLDKLSSFLSDNKKALSRKYFPEDETFNLITTKGFLPYDYLSSLSKLEETSLPPMESFYSILTDEDINPQNYEHAKSIWRVFECKTLKDYVMIYQMCDVLLLADVFEDFRAMSMREFQLDPLYYVSTPGLTFDAMLRYTNVTIDLLTDLEMVKFVQRGMRGGLVGCSHRLSRANNPYMEHLYDPTKPTSYLWYIDANNLYGFCLSKHLPISEFTWVEGNDDLVKEVLQLPPDSDTGYFLEADFQYPDHLHDTHNDMPFLPEVQVIDGQNMLMETLGSRTKYVCHYRALQQAVEHGLILTKIHRGIKFNQSPYIAPYVELTTKKRIESGNPFEEEFWKLMNNALYGKTCERVEKRIRVVVPTTCEQASKLSFSPQFIDSYDFGESLVMYNMAPKTIVFDKPIFIGAAVLDLSKVHLFSFYYDVLKPKYRDNIQINYKDTDAYAITIYTQDLYNDIANDPKILNELDTRNYDPKHPLHSLKNKLVLGKFKDELAPNILTEFVGLRSKEYATKKFDVKEKIEETNKKKSKGTQKRVVQKEVDFEDYKDSLFNTRPKEEKTKTGLWLDNVRISSSKGAVSLIKQRKLCLNPDDKKRYILPNKIDTLAFGHYAIPKPDLD